MSEDEIFLTEVGELKEKGVNVRDALLYGSSASTQLWVQSSL